MFDSLLQTKLYLPPTRTDWVEKIYIYGKLGVSKRALAIARARELGLIK